jgi:hypothetical protein
MKTVQPLRADYKPYNESNFFTQYDAEQRAQRDIDDASRAKAARWIILALTVFWVAVSLWGCR